MDVALVPGNNIQLPCQLHSNLAQVRWRLQEQTLHSDSHNNNKYYIMGAGLLILAASEADAGLYACDSVEQIHGRTYNRTVALYQLQLRLDPGPGEGTTPGTGLVEPTDSSPGPNITDPDLDLDLDPEEPLGPENQSESGRVTGLEVAVALLSLLSLCLMGVILWRSTLGRRSCFKFAQRSGENEAKRQSAEYTHIPNRTSEIKLLGPESGRPFMANNNHSVVDFKGNGEHHFTPMANISSLDGLGYINDESEI